jgi:hypothetical protein
MMVVSKGAQRRSRKAYFVGLHVGATVVILDEICQGVGTGVRHRDLDRVRRALGAAE